MFSSWSMYKMFYSRKLCLSRPCLPKEKYSKFVLELCKHKMENKQKWNVVEMKRIHKFFVWHFWALFSALPNRITNHLWNRYIFQSFHHVGANFIFSTKECKRIACIAIQRKLEVNGTNDLYYTNGLIKNRYCP